MTATIENELASALAWLRQEAARVPFGELTVRLVMHGGVISRTERGVTTKLQPIDGNNGHGANR